MPGPVRRIHRSTNGVSLPRSGFGKAMRYGVEQWPSRRNYALAVEAELDNNGCESAIRPVAIGRKNHFGSRSLRGTEVAALFYSLLESAKMAGVDPAEYLRVAVRRAIENPGTITLPHELLDI